MLPNLRILHMERRCHRVLYLYDAAEASIWESSPIRLLPGAFRSLEMFTGCFLSLRSALRLVLHPYFPLSHLTCLDLEFTYANGCEVVNLTSFMERTAPHLDCLQTLRISFTELVYRSSLSTIGSPDDVPSLDFSTISAFLSFRQLTAFCLHHPHPIRMTEDDLETVAVQGTRFSQIWLNPNPRWPHRDRLPPLSCLIPFAIHCPRLLLLGLCMDCSSLPACIPSNVRFGKLEELYVGTSLVPAHMDRMYPEWVKPARYLADILPEGCAVINDTSVRLGIESPGPDAVELQFPNFRYFEIAWRSICGMVAVIHAVRRRMETEEDVVR